MLEANCDECGVDIDNRFGGYCWILGVPNGISVVSNKGEHDQAIYI